MKTIDDPKKIIKKIDRLQTFLEKLNDEDFVKSRENLSKMWNEVKNPDNQEPNELNYYEQNLFRPLNNKHIAEDQKAKTVINNIEEYIKNLQNDAKNCINKAFEENASKIYKEILQIYTNKSDNITQIAEAMKNHFNEVGINSAASAYNKSPGEILESDYYALAQKIIADFENRKATRTTILDHIRNFIDEMLGTNLVLESSKSQRDSIKDAMKETAQGKFTEKYNTIVPNDQAPSR